MDVGKVIVRRLDGEMTVRVKLSRGFSVRLRLGLWLMKLGARIMPMRVKVNEVEVDG